jgi:hypothetical protein
MHHELLALLQKLCLKIPLLQVHLWCLFLKHHLLQRMSLQFLLVTTTMSIFSGVFPAKGVVTPGNNLTGRKLT